MKVGAVCLAAGQGKRMGSRVQKQYLLLEDRPVLFYSLEELQKSKIDEVILVVAKGEEEYCKKEIVEKYSFTKVKKIVAGGQERYHSVYQGLMQMEDIDYVLIHDGARPFLTEEIIDRCIAGAVSYRACVAAMPVKDTIKLADDKGNIASTPDRTKVWQIQTPQGFYFPYIKSAYEKLMESEEKGENFVPVTDDAMVIETFMDIKVRLVHGSYENIKITTPEDLVIAEAFLKKSKKIEKRC